MAMLVHVQASTYGQKVSLNFKNASLSDVLDEIQKQTGYDFLYNSALLGKQQNITIKVSNTDLEQVLTNILSSKSLSFEVDKNSVLIKQNRSAPKRSNIRTQNIGENEVQKRTVSGTIRNTLGEPLAGATVVIKGTNIGTSTNEEGQYSIPIDNSHKVLVFSSVGFISQDIEIGNRTNINVSLQGQVDDLEEVVVVGYGTMKRSSLTSAVSDIKGEELVKRPVANAPQALQGLAPGITVLDRGGAPGKSNASIRIRGVTTLGENDPLVIIDGLEQGLQDINPDDIETLTVLKDAASTAIYGSRAANGVILVTTKRGRPGKVAVNYSGYYAIQNSAYNPEHMGLEDFLRLENVAAVNAGMEPKRTEDEIQQWIHATDRYKYPMPNEWFDVFLSPAPQQNHTLSLSGGSEQITTLLSANYFKQDGIIPVSKGDRKDIRLNTDYKVSERIHLSGDFSYRVKDYVSPFNEDLAFRYMLSGSNFAVPQYPDGTYGLGSENYSPFVTAIMDGTSDYFTTQAVTNLKAEVKILDGLKFITQYANRYNQYYQKDFENAYEIRDYYNKDNVLKSVSPNALTETRNQYREYTLNNLLQYDGNWSKHTLSALVGYSQIGHKTSELEAVRKEFYNNDVQSIGQGSETSRDNDGLYADWGLRSFFSRVTYNYDSRYYLEGNGRYDGSSRFTGDNVYSFFPSLSGAWRLSEETFWQPLKGVVNEFKIKGSWGKAGNQTVSLYSYFETLAALNYNFGDKGVQGLIQESMANKDITWETTTQSDIGLESEFLDGKLSLVFDYYNKKTEGILLTLPIPSVIGLTAPPQNAGVVSNKGWELSLTHRNNIRDFKYAVTANLSDVRNKILSLEGTGPYTEGGPNEILTVRQEGLPIDAYIGYKTSGFFQTQEEVDNYPKFDPATTIGDVKYTDMNDDGVINSDDYVVLGSDIPRYTFGLNLNLEYKNFDINVFFQGVGKVNGIPSGAFREQGNWGGFALAIGKDYWTPENPDAQFPRPKAQSIHNSQMSDFWMIDASYIKLKNLQIGYNFPSSITEKIKVHRLRAYASGSNLFTISKATKWGLDPEFPSGRLNYYPQVSLFTLGLNLGF